MKHWIKLSTLAALSAALLAGTVQAQTHDDRGRHGGSDRTPSHSMQHGNMPSHSQPNASRPSHSQPSSSRPSHSQPSHSKPSRVPPHTPSVSQHRHDFQRGQRLPQDYRSHQYVVDNWRAHNLHAPARGQHWVMVGGDYLLVTVATGIIASVLLAH